MVDKNGRSGPVSVLLLLPDLAVYPQGPKIMPPQTLHPCFLLSHNT